MSGTYAFCQTPLKSTLPDARRGVGPVGGWKPGPPRWPAAGSANSAARTSAASRLPRTRAMAPSSVFRRVVAARRSGEHAAAVGQLHQPGVARVRSVLRAHAVDCDAVADLQRVRA